MHHGGQWELSWKQANLLQIYLVLQKGDFILVYRLVYQSIMPFPLEALQPAAFMQIYPGQKV